MATELGVAYISVSASTKQFAKDVKAALADVEAPAEATGQKSGSVLGKGLATGLKVGTAAVAGLTAMVGALALKGGISRALAIEDSKAKLAGLGHSAESVTAIMESAMASVKGTAFGLGEAATVAASAVAANVKPGADLQRTLSLVADAATIAGTDMGSMGAIFNKVAASNKVQMDVINQLHDAGVPALQLLAAEMGVTAAEASKMASAGKIDFATFQAAMESGLGGAALKSGETFRGAMKNAGAALSRLGEKVASPVLARMTGGFGDAIGALDNLGPVAERVGEMLGEAFDKAASIIKDDVVPALRNDIIPALKDVGDWVQKNRDWLAPLAVAIGAAAIAWDLYKFAANAAKAVQIALNLAMAANPIGLVVAAIAALVAGLVWFFTQTEAGKNAWAAFTDFLSTAWDKVKVAWESFKEAASAVWQGILDAVQPVVDWFGEHVVPVFQAYGELLAAVWDRVGQAASWLWTTVLQPVFSAISAAWQVLWEVIQAAWDKVGPPLTSFIQMAFTNLGTVLSGIWETMKAVFQGTWNAIKIIVETVLGVIKGVINTVTAVIKGDWSGAWSSIKETLRVAWDGMVSLAKNAVSTLGNVIGTIKDTVMGVFNTASSWLKDTGRKIIDGLIDGIKGAFRKVKETLSGLTDLLPDWKGPAEVDAKLLTGNGRLIMQSLIGGFEAEESNVQKYLRGFTADLGNSVNPSLAVTGSLSNANAGTGVTQHITVNYPIAEPTSTTTNKALQYAAAIGEGV